MDVEKKITELRKKLQDMLNQANTKTQELAVLRDEILRTDGALKQLEELEKEKPVKSK